ncbi:hypothetical protein E4U46_005303 [Claviceps purpurea]|nr:hypothetical protein E4U46_005303 [Claviceps purpurea]
MSEVEAVLDAEGKLDPLARDKLEIGAELEADKALKTSTEVDATLKLEVDSVTGSVKVVGREDARPDETGPDEMRLELVAEPGVAAEPDKPESVEIDCELGTRADNDVPDDAVTDEMKEPSGIDDVGLEGVNPDGIDKAAPYVAGDDKVDVKEAGVSEEIEPDNSELVAPDELELAVVGELDDAKFVEAGEDGPTGVDSEGVSPDEVGIDRLGTEEVLSFESDGGDMKPTFGSGISRVNGGTPSDVMPDDGLPDNAERDKTVVKPEAVPDDEGPESERLDGGCVSDDTDSLDDEADDAGLGDKLGTVADESSEVRSDEPRRTLVIKPEDVKPGHEGLKEDREEEAGPETAEEGVTSEPDKISVELEPKVNDASWVVDPTSEDVVPNDSVVDTPRDERSDNGDPNGRVSDDVRPDGAESDWDINDTGWYDVAADSDDSVPKDTKLDGAELHVDIVEGPGCVLVADPDDDNPGADEADATDSKEVPEGTRPDELDATRLEEVTPYDAGSDEVRSEDDGGTVDSELDETVLGITEPEGDACNDPDVADEELGESALVDCELDDNGNFTKAGADEKITDAGPDEAGSDEVKVDDVSSAAGIDDAVSNDVETDDAAIDTDRLDGSNFGSFDVGPDDEGTDDSKLDSSPEDGELVAEGVKLVTAAAVNGNDLRPDAVRLERSSDEAAPDALVPDKAVVKEIRPDELGSEEAGLETALDEAGPDELGLNESELETETDEAADGADADKLDPEATGPDEAGPDEAGAVEARSETVSDELGLNGAGLDEAGPEEVESDVVWPENVKLDDGILWKRDLCNSGRLLEDTRSVVAWLEAADTEISDAKETGFVADCGSEDVAEIDNSIAFEEVSTINVFDEVGVDVSGSELDKTDEARPEDCGGTPEEVAGVAKTGRDDAEIEEAELRDPMAEDARSDETAYDDDSAEEAVPDEDTFEEVPLTLDEVAAGTPRLSDSALALVDWSLCDVSATRVVPLDLNAGTRDVCELDSRIVSVVVMLNPMTLLLLLLGAKLDCVESSLLELLGLTFWVSRVESVDVAETLAPELLVPALTLSRAEGVDKTAPLELVVRSLTDCTL